MDSQRLRKFVRDCAAYLDPAAHAIGFDLRLPVWVNFDYADGRWHYCCAKYGGPGASVYEKSADFAATGKRLASEHSGISVLFVPIRPDDPALGVCFAPEGECLAFQAGYADFEPEILRGGLEDLKPVLDALSRGFERDAPALAGMEDPLAQLSVVVDDALAMAGISGTRASILADAVKGAVGRTVRAAQSNPFAASAADTACSSFIAALISQQGLIDKASRLAEEAQESKQADKRLANLAKEHETLKLVSEGYRKRAERHSLEILDLQRKLKAARGVLPVAAPEDLAQRLAPLYGVAVS